MSTPGQTAALSYKDALNGAISTIQNSDNRPKEMPSNSLLIAPDNSKVSTLFSDQIRSQASPIGLHKGEPAIRISEVEEATIAEPFKYTLIGKFDWGRPAMVIIRREVQAAGFSGPCFVGLIDSQHVVFRFELETDFQRMWLKQTWSFRGFKAQMFKWTTDFRTDIESPIAPVWINFPLLPLHCFNKKILFVLASVVGKPLKTDMATAAALQTIRPSIARVCVEADLTKAAPERVWIGKDDKGMWQTIQIEDKPKYCTKCYKLGHLHMECELSETLERKNQSQQVWRQKESRARTQDPQKPPMNGSDKGKSIETSVYIASTSMQQPIMDTVPKNGDKGPSEVQQEMNIQTAHVVDDSNLAQFLVMVGDSALVAEPSTQHDEENEGTRERETTNRDVEQSTLSQNHGQIIVCDGGNKGSSADPPILQKDSILQNDFAILNQIEEIRTPITIDFQQYLLNQVPKVPSTSDLQNLQLITTESETDNQLYGDYSEWEEGTESEAYMETLSKSKHKPRKHKTNKMPFSTSSRKLRSHKQGNAFGYESR